MTEFDIVWNGRDELIESLDRDYAAMRGDGWDLIWEPPSPLTTPWDDIIRRKGNAIDSEVFIATEMERAEGTTSTCAPCSQGLGKKSTAATWCRAVRA